MYERMDLSKGLTFDLDVKWFKENILGKACIYCGDTKNLGCDRINNNIGHVKDNCVPCCYLCNITRKDDYTFEEMKILGRAIRKNIDNLLIKRLSFVQKIFKHRQSSYFTSFHYLKHCTSCQIFFGSS